MTARLCARRSNGAGWSTAIAWRGRPPAIRSSPGRNCINAWASSIRSAVERALATMKRWYGMSRVRYLGLARNACHLKFVAALAMNMKRALVLMEKV